MLVPTRMVHGGRIQHGLRGCALQPIAVPTRASNAPNVSRRGAARLTRRGGPVAALRETKKLRATPMSGAERRSTFDLVRQSFQELWFPRRVPRHFARLSASHIPRRLCGVQQ